jgi:hypothetical protein
MNKIYPNLKSKKEEPKKEEEKETEAKNDSIRLFNYSRFLSINEADESQPDLENEKDTNDESKNETESDEVKTEWSKEFKEGEEKDWTVDEKEAKELQKETDELENKPVEVKADDYYDHIIRIVNIFEKAYKLYATEVIPSGRPNGRISQKTFREYEYIGDKAAPEWSADKGPEAGPWAAKLPFQKWQDGVMGILEKPEYRKILANVKFVSGAEASTDTKMKKPGSGRTLFTFINELLAGEGNFRKLRKKVLDDYFTTEEAKKKSEETGGDGSIGSLLPIKEDDKGETNQLSFETTKTIGFVPQRDNFKNGKNTLIKSFTLFEYKSKSGLAGKMVAYLTNPIKTDEKNYLLFKFQLGGVQSIISTYMSKTIQKDKLKLPKEVSEKKTAKVYIGIIDLSDGYFANGQAFDIKYIDASKLKTASDDDFKTMSITNVSNTKYLTRLRDTDKNEQKREIVKIKETESHDNTTDIVGVNKLITKDQKLKEKFGITGNIKA